MKKISDRGQFEIVIPNMFSNDKYSKFIFYATMISHCSIVINNNLPAPAGVSFHIDHYILYINTELFDEYTLEEQIGILTHEMLHILNNHVMRKEDRNHKAWNYSTDCAINQLIGSNMLPTGAIFPSNLGPKNLKELESSEYYYDKLLEDNQDNQDTADNQDDADNSSSNGKLIDDHDMWEQSTGDVDLQKDITKKMIEQSIDSTLKNKGIVPSEINNYLNLFTRKSELSWKQMLKRLTGNKKTNSTRTILRRDRRQPVRNDIKGKIKKRTFDVLLISDVSGSVSDTSVITLWSEVQNICRLTKTDLNLIQVDSKPYEPTKINKTTKIISRLAHGGTYLSPALDKAKECKLNYNVVVVTTDGYLDSDDIDKINNCNKRVIWLIEPSGQIHPSMNSKKSQAFLLKGNHE